MKPYYQEDGITIYLGDCRDILPSLGQFDLLLTDPPYGVGFKGKKAKQRGGGIKANTGGYSFDDSPENVSKNIIPVIEWGIKSCLAVVVTPGIRCLWLYPPADDLGCFYSAAGTGMGKWGFTCMQPILYYGSDPFLRNCKGSMANSYGKSYPNDANKSGHPCAKPIKQWTWLVNRASAKGESILDPFMGSGTTLEAAKNLGRQATGIELEEKFCEIAVKRLAQGVLPL